MPQHDNNSDRDPRFTDGGGALLCVVIALPFWAALFLVAHWRGWL